MNCRKCGTELHPDQKVCIKCGTPTPAGGGFDVEETERWRPSKNMIIGAGVAVGVLIIALVIAAMRTAPPEVVAKEWFDAMSNREIRKARQYITAEMEQSLEDTTGGLLALSDEYFVAVTQDNASVTFGKPRFDVEDNPTAANVTIALKYPDGRWDEVEVQMTKVGRSWRINQIVMSTV